MVVDHNQVLLPAIIDHAEVLHADALVGHAVLPKQALLDHHPTRVQDRDDFVCVVFSAGGEHNNLELLVQLLQELVGERSDKHSNLLVDLRVRLGHI